MCHIHFLENISNRPLFFSLASATELRSLFTRSGLDFYLFLVVKTSFSCLFPAAWIDVNGLSFVADFYFCSLMRNSALRITSEVSTIQEHPGCISLLNFSEQTSSPQGRHYLLIHKYDHIFLFAFVFWTQMLMKLHMKNYGKAIFTLRKDPAAPRGLWCSLLKVFAAAFRKTCQFFLS